MFLKGASEYNKGTADASSVQIRALDDHTFQMDLIGPLPYAVGALPLFSFAIVPKHAIEKYGAAWTDPKNIVCNGPFVLSEHVPQISVTCTKNPYYWDKDNVKLDKVVFYATDSTTSYNMYLNGEVDWDTNVPPDQIKAAIMRPDFHTGPQLATFYFMLQTQKAPLNDVRVRRALSLAVDRWALVNRVTQAGEIPAWGFVPPLAGYEALPFPENGDREAYLAEAQALLADAGYPNGVGFPTLTLIYDTNENYKKIVEFVQQEWKTNLGITVNLENQEWQTYLANKNMGNFQIARARWVGDYQDPSTFLNMFITGAGMNGGRYSNETYDLLLNEAARISNPSERLGVLKTAEDILINQDQDVFPIYYYVTLNMIDTDKWGGWNVNIMDYHPVKDIYRK